MRAASRIFIVHSALAFFLIAPVTLMAQDAAPEGKPITAIEVQPEGILSLSDISRLTGIEPGMSYSSGAIRTSLDLLYQTGQFTDIRVSARIEDGGVVIRYNFIEKTFLAGLVIKGNWAFFDRKIEEALGIRIGEEFTESRWKKAITRLVGFYHRHGYFQIQVTSDITREEGTNRIHTLIRVKEGNRARIRETLFTGHKVFSDLRLWSLVRSRRGEFYDAPLVERDLQALEEWYRSKGYLQAIIGPPEVGYLSDTNAVSLTFPIEAETLLRLQFEGRHAFKPRLLESHLLFREERSYDEDVFHSSADRLKRFYQSKGYPFVKVQWSRQEKPEDKTILAVFTIQEGPLTCLRSVKIEGNRFFSTRKLLDLLSTRPSRNPIFCRILDQNVLKEDIERIGLLYREAGFQETKVDQTLSYPEGATEAARAAVSVTLTVQEGIQTLIDQVVMAGNRAFTSSELIKHTRLRSGMPYSENQARQDTDELLRFYVQQGYIYARIEPERLFSDDRSRVGLTYAIEEDAMARIGRIFLEGNTFTRDYVIERELRIKSGDPYNEEDIQLSRLRILRLGYLGEVRFQPVRPISLEQKEYIKDMVLSVRERPPKAVEFGIGYADVDHLRGFVELSHKNLAGTGRSLSLRSEASEIERKTTLTFIEPWLFSLPLDARANALYQRQIRPAYDLTTVGSSVGIEKDLTETLQTSLFYQVEFNNFTDVPEEVLAKEDQGRVNIATLNPSLILDTRDNPFNPTSGTLSGLVFRVGAKSLGSEVQIRKTTVHSNWFFPLTRWLVVALSARGGIAEKFGESKEVPPSEKFFLGGRSSVRGYAQDELGILNETIVNGVPTGGNAVLIGNVEFRFFLPGGLGFVLFNDRGNVWLSYEEVNLNELKSTVGAGLRYNTPVGPLRLDVGYKLDRVENLCPTCSEPIEESQYEVHFTLGHAF